METKNINTIPPEIILHIFSFFEDWSQCVHYASCVCKLWRKLITESTHLFQSLCLCELSESCIEITEYTEYYDFWKSNHALFNISRDSKSRWQYYSFTKNYETMYYSVYRNGKWWLIRSALDDFALLVLCGTAAGINTIKTGRTFPAFFTLCMLANCIRKSFAEDVAIIATGKREATRIQSHFVTDLNDIIKRTKEEIKFKSGRRILFVPSIRTHVSPEDKDRTIFHKYAKEALPKIILLSSSFLFDQYDDLRTNQHVIIGFQ